MRWRLINRLGNLVRSGIAEWGYHGLLLAGNIHQLELVIRAGWSSNIVAIQTRSNTELDVTCSPEGGTNPEDPLNLSASH